MADATASHDGVEVTSSHDTADQIRAALGVTQEPQTQPVETPDEPLTEQPDAGEPPAESVAGQTLAKKRRTLQDRIDQITREKYDTARERDEARSQATRLERELTDLRRTATGIGPAKPEAAAVPPATAKFPKYAEYLQAHPDAELEDWIDARDSWRDEQRTKQQTQQESERRQRETHDARTQQFSVHAQTFATKMRAVLDADPEFETKLDRRLLTTPALSVLPPGETPTFGNFLVEQIVKADHPDKLLLHLSDPHEVQRLASLDPESVIRELTRLDLGTPNGNGAAPRGPAPAASVTTRAKPPIKPLGGSPPVETDVPPGDDASDEAHRLYWNRQELARRSR